MKLSIAEDLSLPIDVVTQTISILAKRRAGKSYTMRRLVEQLFAASQQIVLVDPKGDQWGIRSSADGKAPGLPVIILGGERGDAPLESTAGEIVAKLVVEQRVSALLDLSLFRKHEVATFMTAFMENLYRLKAREIYRTPMMLVIDEADAIAPQKPQKGEERMLGAAEDIVRRGGQRGIGCVLVTQRSAVLNKNVLTQSQILVALRTIAPQDLDAMDAWIQVHGEPEQRKMLMESLPSLPVGDAWFWSPGWPTNDGIFKRVHVLPIETFDSGATPKPGVKPVEPKQLADVDLEALKEQMASTIQRAKDNDPAELKRTIADLKRKLAEAERSKPKVEQKTVEVPILDDASKRLLEKVNAACDDVVERSEARRLQFQELTEQLNSLRAEIGTAVSRPMIDLRHPDSAKAIAAFKTSRPKLNHASDTIGNGTLSGGARAILIAAAQHPQGVTDEQIAVLTGYRKTSRATFKQRLMSQGYLAQGGLGYVATDEGVKALGNDFDPLPTGDDLRQYWLQRLSGGELEIFKTVVNLYPAIVPRHDLEQMTGYKKTSLSTFCQRLSARRLIVTFRNGIAANKELFE